MSEKCLGCGPEKECQACVRATPLKLEGARARLVAALLEFYMPLPYECSAEEKEAHERRREWLVRVNGWDTQSLAELSRQVITAYRG